MEIGYKLLSVSALIMLCGLSCILAVNFGKASKSLKRFSYFVFGSLVFQLIAFATSELGIKNLILVHFYSLFQFVTLSMFYYAEMDTKWKKRLILFQTTGVSILMILYSLFNDKMEGMNSLGVFISNGSIIIYTVMYYFRFIDKEIETRKKAYLLINTGVLLFMSESLILFLFGDILIKMEFFDQVSLWLANVSVYVLFLILVLIELWRHLLKEPKISSST